MARARADARPAAPALASGLVALLADMRAAVTTYVGRRRGEGAPVQRILPEVKALVQGAVCGAEMREMAELLVAHAVRWSIEAYYAPDDATEELQARSLRVGCGDARAGETRAGGACVAGIQAAASSAA